MILATIAGMAALAVLFATARLTACAQTGAPLPTACEGFFDD